MATSYVFNGRIVKLPGVYSQTKSAVSNSPANLDYGKIVIVDTDNSNFSGGAGIDGEISQGQGSIYEFDNLIDFRQFLRGGKLWDIALPLFKPFGQGHMGVSTIYYVRPMTTIPATVSLAFLAGTMIVKSRHEGTCGNGVEVSAILTQGFGVNLESGVANIAKFRLRFSRGTYTGVDANGVPYNNLAPVDSVPETIALSPEVATLDELVAWMAKDYDFNNAFILTTPLITGAIVPADLATLVGNKLFAGGTQTYSAANLTLALDAIKDLDYTHMLSVDFGAVNATSLINLSLLYHLENEAKYEKFLVVGGGEDKSEFGNSLTMAATFNSDRVILVHGANLESDRVSGTKLRVKTSLHKAAYVLGRVVGLEPQTPPTFKGLGYSGESHQLTDRERTQALDAGVLTTYYDSQIGSFVITQGINTLQDNENIVNDNGTSFLWSLKRIASQLNKEIEINMKKQLLGSQSQGPNRNTLSEEVISQWVESYLSRKTAKETVDNLILSFKNILVTTKQDSYWVSYEFEPNFEVNKMFVTGFIIDPK